MDHNQEKEYDTYYHYTDRDSAKKIVKSGKIKQSTGGPGVDDIVHGPGVYLTKMDPGTHSKSQIARNNYDGAPWVFNAQKNKGKVDAAIAVKFPKDDRPDDCDAKRGRDVHKYDGDIDLSKYPYEVHSVKGKPNKK